MATGVGKQPSFRIARAQRTVRPLSDLTGVLRESQVGLGTEYFSTPE